MFMPHKPTLTIKTVGDRSIAWAGPLPSPNISPTSCVDDIFVESQTITPAELWQKCYNISSLNLSSTRAEARQRDGLKLWGGGHNFLYPIKKKLLFLNTLPTSVGSNQSHLIHPSVVCAAKSYSVKWVPQPASHYFCRRDFAQALRGHCLRLRREGIQQICSTWVQEATAWIFFLRKVPEELGMTKTSTSSCKKLRSLLEWCGLQTVYWRRFLGQEDKQHAVK